MLRMKWAIYLLLTILLSTFSLAIADDFISYYPLYTDANDYNNVNNLSATGSPTQTTSSEHCHNGECYYFPGGTGTYFSIASATGFITSNNPRTTCAWVKESSGGAYVYSVAQGTSSGSDGWWTIAFNNLNNPIMLSGTTNSPALGAVSLNSTNYICFAWDGSKRIGYLNGTNIANSTDNVATSSTKFMIGANPNGDEGVNGWISDVTYWDRVLTPQEINEIFLNDGIPYAIVAGDGNLSIDWITPTTNDNHTQNELKEYTFNVSCSGGNCNGAEVWLDPEVIETKPKKILPQNTIISNRKLTKQITTIENIDPLINGTLIDFNETHYIYQINYKDLNIEYQKDIFSSVINVDKAYVLDTYKTGIPVWEKNSNTDLKTLTTKYSVIDYTWIPIPKINGEWHIGDNSTIIRIFDTPVVDETGGFLLSNNKLTSSPDIPMNLWSPKLIRWNTFEECSGNQTRDASFTSKTTGWIENMTTEAYKGNCANGANSAIDSLTNQWPEINTFDSQGFETCFWVQPQDLFIGGNGVIISSRIFVVRFNNLIDWQLTLSNSTGSDYSIQSGDTNNTDWQFICAGYNKTDGYIYQNNDLIVNVSINDWVKKQNNDFLVIGGTSGQFNLDDIFMFRAQLSQSERDWLMNDYILTNSTITTSYNETPYINSTITINISKSYTDNADVGVSIKYLNNTLLPQSKSAVFFTGEQKIITGNISYNIRGFYGTNQNDTYRYYDEGIEVVNFKESIDIYSGNNRGYNIYNVTIKDNVGLTEYVKDGYTAVIKYKPLFNTTSYSPYVFQMTDKNLLDLYHRNGKLHACSINGCYGQGSLETGTIIVPNETYTIAITYGGYEGYGRTGTDQNMSIWVNGVLEATEVRGNLSTPKNITAIGILGLANEAGSGGIGYFALFNSTFDYDTMVEISNGSLDYVQTDVCFNSSCKFDVYNSYADAVAFTFINNQNNKSALVNSFNETYDIIVEGGVPPTPTGKGIINNTVGANPFYHNGTSISISCGDMTSGESCSVSFYVNATGSLDTYEFFGIANSTNALGANSTTINITIVAAGGAADTCTCAGLNNDWNVSMSDYCFINTNCNLGTGTLTFYNNGFMNISAIINSTGLGSLTSAQTIYIHSDGVLNIY